MAASIEFTTTQFRHAASEPRDPVRLAWALSGAVHALMLLRSADPKPEIGRAEKEELLRAIFLAHANALLVLDGTSAHASLNECLPAVTGIAISVCSPIEEGEPLTPELRRDFSDLGRVLRNDLHNFVLRSDLAMRRAERGAGAVERGVA